MTMIDTADPRFAKAIEISAGAAGWLKCRLASGGKAFGVPSQTHDGVYHLVNSTSCTCFDFVRHGKPCKHVEAVLIHCALVRAQAAKPKPRRHLTVIKTTRED